MNLLSKFLSSRLLAGILVLAIAASLLIRHKILTKARLDWNDFEQRRLAENQDVALAHAFEEYYADHPTAEAPANNGEWTKRLGGINEGNVRYLKTEKYARDSLDRLLDPKGIPYVVEVDGAEFHVRSDGYPETGISNGNRQEPGFPKAP